MRPECLYELTDRQTDRRTQTTTDMVSDNKGSLWLAVSRANRRTNGRTDNNVSHFRALDYGTVVHDPNSTSSNCCRLVVVGQKAAVKIV